MLSYYITIFAYYITSLAGVDRYDVGEIPLFSPLNVSLINSSPSPVYRAYLLPCTPQLSDLLVFSSGSHGFVNFPHV